MRTLSKRIAESVNYFIANPEKRCNVSGGCYYSPKKAEIQGRGCAVGFFLRKEDRETIDETFGAIGVVDLIQEFRREKKGYKFTLPKIVVDNPMLMNALQEWHDHSGNFFSDGLSQEGKDMMADLITDYKLDKNDFNI